ncbi:MerR family transcriptional regulator [Pseudarthrobacter sp. AL07]|uniref:MerR family transcriptional regulator n=1 Tax=unclassified Pseudarthrobacter TaxID=2647000 RepID=UPI00249B4A3B|nr:MULTISPECIES: MerR family transcriptional regulator [unclassified Pseudarthrobacter]MDI3194427.1 MerR family transcriptional regulator [Pseudarthrobacter sp. AL20]MDI3208494.1 MerR family transcriptional regulator [Pseudarthrobacter sp. AL07]
MAAKLAGTGQQNIRLYETKGLILPERTAGGTRQYSDADVALLLHIGELLDQGINLAGIAKVLELEVANAELRLALRRVRPRQEA